MNDETCVFFTQGHPNKIYANLGHVTDTTGPVNRREQIKRPFRILVYKSPIVAHYPLKFIKVLHAKIGSHLTVWF